ncbi:MAG: electron transfer flavoprotein subunit alpha/FixB family protein, partial [Trueperella pyogenes]|nr:electron transfer flavoprotein subunit alpha/FixB family protein [Trueperella pyogenes]
MTNAWIITTSNQIASLVEAARAIGPVTVIALGDEATGIAGVDRVVTIGRGSNAPLEAFAPAVNAVLEGAGADIIFAANRPVERVLAGAVAARLGLPLINGALRVSAGEAEVSRFGGLTQESISFPGGAVVVLEGGAPVEGAEVSPEAGSEEHYEASVSAVEPAGSGPANLAAARRIVAAGRGFKAEEDLQIARDLAAALGAELA